MVQRLMSDPRMAALVRAGRLDEAKRQMDAEMTRFHIERSMDPNPPALFPLRRSRKELVAYQNKEVRSMELAKGPAGSGWFHQTSSIGSRIERTVQTRIQDLRSVLEPDLGVDKEHPGTVLFCRTITTPCTFVGLATVAEDAGGTAFRLAVYNLVPDTSLTTADKALSKGSLLAIKEPYYRKSRDGGLTVRIDNPANLVRLQSSDMVLKTTPWYVAPPTRALGSAAEPDAAAGLSDLRERRKHHFERNEVEEAIECYKECCKLDPKDASLLSNLAECYLRIGDFEAALGAAEDALTLDPNHAKSSHRKSRALMGLGRYREAIEAVKVPSLKGNKSAQGLIKDCEARVPEVEEGRYQWNSLLSKTIEQPETRLDVAEFVGPIEIVPIPGKGMGVRAKEALKAGQLLVVSKAASILFPSEIKATSLHVDLDRRVMSAGKDMRLVEVLFRELPRQQHLRKQVLSLSRGRYEGPKTTDADTDSPSGEPEFPDYLVITDVAGTNKFGWRPWNETYQFRTKFRSADRSELQDPIGLWVVPSRFNHSCISNCTYTFVGDLMVVHAVQDIEQGEELTLPYKPFDTDAGKQDKFKAWGFECDCDYCRMKKSAPRLPSGGEDWRRLATAEEGDASMRQLKSLVDLARSQTEGTPRNMERFRQLVKRVESDLPQLPPVAVADAFYPLSMAANFAMKTELYDEAAAIFAKIFEMSIKETALAVNNPHAPIKSALQVCAALASQGDRKGAKTWLEKGRGLFLRYWPGARNVFDKLYGTELTAMGMRGA